MIHSTNTASHPIAALFPLGDIVVTPGADAVLKQYSFHPIRLIARHVHGDWGEVSPEDAQSNSQALLEEGRLLSCYRMPGGEQLWLLTECDRSVTTIMVREEH